jgi:hypothetical protein
MPFLVLHVSFEDWLHSRRSKPKVCRATAGLEFIKS